MMSPFTPKTRDQADDVEEGRRLLLEIDATHSLTRVVTNKECAQIKLAIEPYERWNDGVRQAAKQPMGHERTAIAYVGGTLLLKQIGADA